MVKHEVLVFLLRCGNKKSRWCNEGLKNIVWVTVDCTCWFGSMPLMSCPILGCGGCCHGCCWDPVHHEDNSQDDTECLDVDLYTAPPGASLSCLVVVERLLLRVGRGLVQVLHMGLWLKLKGWSSKKLSGLYFIQFFHPDRAFLPIFLLAQLLANPWQ